MNEFVGYIDDQGRVFDGTFDYEGHVGPIGPQGEPGYTPQRGVDYWTDEDKAYVVAEATSLINGKIEEYNANATAKTNAFNQNASDKTDAFNSNASDKTTAFDNNASTKTATFNINAASKKSDFNDNAAAKTTAFDAHVDSEFDDLTGNFYTKAQVDAKIASTYHYKGSVTDYTELPSSGQQVGDVYNIENAGGGYNAGDNVAWTGSAWDILAGTVDLTNYYTKSETNTLLDTKQGTIDSSHKVDADLIDDTTSTNKFTTSSDISKLAGIESGAEVNVIETVKVDGTALEVTDKAVDIVGLAAMQSELDDLYAQIPTATATGNPINVQDSSNLPIKDFALLGNATQFTTTGKNKMPTQENAWEQGTLLNGLPVDSNTRIRTKDYYSIERNVTYYISTNNLTYQFLNIWLYDSNYEAIGQYYNKNNSINGTTSLGVNFDDTNFPNATYIKILMKNSSNTNITPSQIIDAKPQLELGSSKTSFEPYTGGTPAPNPDYPQDIHVVTGDNTVVVNGKNLFEIGQTSDYSRMNNDIGINGNTFSVVIKASGDTWTFNTKHNYVGDKTYTLTATASKTYSRFFVRIRKTDDTGWATNSDYTITGWSYNSYYGGWYKDNASTTANVTITIPNCLYWQIGLGYSNNSVTTGDTEKISNVQIEVGSTATTYEPYIEPTTQLLSLGSIELAKIGTYTDRIFKSSGKWYVEKNVGKFTLNGSENWPNDGGTKGTNYRHNIQVSRLSIPTPININNTYLSNYFIARDITSDVGELGTFYLSNIWLVFVDKNKVYNLDQWKTWLSTHNTIIYYALATPTYTEITDTTLIAQLENILAMHTNKNVTNISIVPTGTNAEPTAEVEYRVDLGTVIGNINNAIISLGGNV